MSSNEGSSGNKAITRRGFLKMASAAGLTGATMAVSGCLIQDRTIGETGWIPKHYKGAGAFPVQAKGRIAVNPMDPAIARNDRLCILCAQCIEVCREAQSVFGYFDLPLKGDFVCVHCGQCTLWCPSSSITEKNRIEEVKAALDDPDKFVIVQTAPATRIGLGEEFGLPVGAWVQDRQVAALRALGFDRIFDTDFSADLTIMEEGTELIKRLQGELDHSMPQITSCCPGWVKFAEYFYPDLLDHISTAKSPQQMFGTMVKTYYAEMYGFDPAKMVSVSIMPCTAKKFEATREALNDAKKYWKKDNIKDVDYVLTTRELARLLKEKRIDLNNLPEERYDSMMSEASGAALIFGATGGVMQAALRSVYFLLSGEDCPPEFLELKSLHGLDGIKEASVPIPSFGTVNVAVAHGLKNARLIMEAIRRGEKVPYHFIEVMACRGGCVTGGGQPRATVPPSDAVRAKRIETLLKHDAGLPLRESHENPEVLKLYETFLGHPNSGKAHELLHTEYTSRAHLLNAKRLG